MSIDPLTDGAALLQTTPEQRRGSGGHRDQAAETLPGSPVPGDQVLVSGGVGRKYEDIQLQKERQNGVAGGIRDTDRALRLLGQKIDSLKAPLQTIVKNYPPFSEQDKARVKLLMHYSAIRREIEQLTVPPPPDAVKARISVKIPDPLSSSAKDSQINDHLAKLDAVSTAVTDARRTLAAKTAAFSGEEDASGSLRFAVAGGNPASGGSLTEQEAREKSFQVGRQFAASPTQGVADQPSQVLKLLS